MQTKFEQLLDYLVNEETDKANELFHQIVVEKSRTIYENLIAEESKEEDKEEKAEESFGHQEESVIEIGGSGDQTDDLMIDVGMDGDDDMGDMDDMGGDDMGDMGDEIGGEDEEQDARIDDLEDALADLKAEFEKLMAGEEGEEGGEEGEIDFGGEEGEEEGEEEKDESFIREYTEKVTAGHGAEKKGSGESSVNAKSPVAGENRMGGVTPKLGQGDEKGGVKGGLVNPSPKDMNTGNVNKPGGTSAKQFFGKDSKGHGAEKKSTESGAGNTKSPLAPSHAK